MSSEPSSRSEVNLPMDDLLQPLIKSRLSEEARRQILDRIADGRLAPGIELVEVELARRLGVSRTPLHEAMVALGRDGLVESLGRKGWRVTPLSEADARDIYPVLAALDVLALDVTAALVLGSLDELRRLAEREKSAASTAERLSCERDWHETLLAQCPNRVLTQTVRPLWVRAARYERARAEAGGSRLPSELTEVVDSLERGQAKAASRLLERHWLERGRVILQWLQSGSPAAGNRGAA